MDTNQHNQTSTPIADNCDPLRTKSGQGLTPHERAIGALLAHSWNLYLRAEGRDHEADGIFRTSINRAQDVLALRVARRVDPDFWNTPAEVTMNIVSNESKCPDCGKERRHDYHAGEPCDECVDRLVVRPPVERPTPETAPLMHAAANESIEAMFRMGCNLERERDEWRNEAERWKKNAENAVNEAKESFESFEKLSIAIGANDGFTRDDDETIVRNSIRIFEQLKGQLAEAREQRDRLADALRDIRQMTRNDERCSVCTEVYHASNAALTALAAVNGGPQ